MARQFKGAAKARGFNPIPISSANINRMREENERIIRGMKERRESQRRNEERQLQAMQADAAYYEKVRARDFDITSTNLRTEQQQLQYDAIAQANRAEEQAKVVNAAFSAVANFSQTAAKMVKQAEDKRNQEDRQKGQAIAERYGFLTYSQLNFDKGLDAEAQARLILSSTAEQMRAAGINEEEVQKTLAIGVQGGLSLFKAQSKLETQSEWPSYLTNYARENNIDLSDTDSAKIWLQDAWSSFEEEKGWSQLSTELLSDALKIRSATNANFIAGISARNTQNIKAQNINDITTRALANWDLEGAQAFIEIKRAEGGSFAAAHEWTVKQFQAMDANGEFYLDEKQLYTFSVMPDGQPYYVPPGESVTINGKTFTVGSHQNRGVQILNGREDKRREWQRNQSTTDRLNYLEESKAWHRHIVVDGNTQDIGAAVASFKDNVQGVPEWLRKLTNAGNGNQGSYNSNLIAQAKDFEARGILHQELVDRVFERDPKIANGLQESLNKQDPFMRDDSYKQYYDSIDKLPLKQDLGGNYPEPNADAIRATGALRDAYTELTKRGVADGALIKDASYSAMKAIESGFNDPNSPFYRQYNANTAQYEFTKLYTKTPKEIAEALDEADTDFLKRLDSGKIQDVFSDPDMILTDAQWDANVASMSRPGYTYPARVDILIKTGHIDGSHMEVMQKIGQLKGRPEIQPPPSLQTVSEYTPKANQMLALWGPRSSNIEARAHGAGMQTSSPEASLTLVPENLREFYQASATQHGVSPAENAAMGEIESAHGKYAVSYNGTSFGVMQINKSAHPDFFAQHNGNPSDQANIEYGTQYYAGLKDRYNGDAIAAAMAYNGGPGNYELWLNGQKPGWVTDPNQTPAERQNAEQEWERIVNEMTNHGKKFAKAYYKYSGDASLLQNPLLLRN